MKNKIYTVLIFTFYITICFGQTNTDLRPQVKSPEVNKFEQYMNMPVNLVSGTPQVNIPIYTLEYGGMTLPISLEYDASGVKVESIASSVGQNWSLNVGGVVSRIVKGAPDEGTSSIPFSNLNVNGYYLNYGLKNLDVSLNVFSPIDRNEQFNLWLKDVSFGKKDSQPDLFYFSTPEGGSKFIFNDDRKIVYLENNNFIIKENFITSYFKTWTATSDNGFIYKFGSDLGLNYGNNNIIEKSCSSAIGELINDSNYRVDSWFLTEISNYKNTNKILIEYIDTKYAHDILNKPNSNSQYCLPNLLQNGSNCNDGDYHYGIFAADSYSTGFSGNVKLNHISSKVISKIKAGQTEINFIYSTREDLIAEFGDTPKKLEEIVVFYDSKCIKKFKFEYTTLQSTIVNNVQNPTDLKRLQLDKLTEISCEGQITKPYLFEYDATLLPSKLSFAQDKWGYYNGKNDNPTIFPKSKFYQTGSFYGDRSVDFLFGKAGSLNKITYPTKGTVNFIFEKHLSNIPTDYYIDYGNPNNTAVSNISPTTPNGNNTFNTSTFTYHEVDQNDILVLKTILMFPSPLNGAYSYGTYAPLSCTPISGTAVEIIDLTINKTIASISYSELKLTPSSVMYGQSYYSSKSVDIKRPINPDLLIDGHIYKINTYGSGNCFYNMTQWNICKYLPIYDVGGLRINKITHNNYDNTPMYENSFRYYSPKIISNPITNHKISWDFSSNYPNNYQSNYSNVAPLNSGILYNKLIENLSSLNNIYMNGYYFNLSSGIDPFDINFMGPNITYSEVSESDNNGVTKSVFYNYKNYFELNSYDSNYKMPPPPKFQSILAGTKQSISQINTNGTAVQNNVNDFNYSIVNTNVKGLISYFYDDGLSFFSTYTIQGQIKTLKKETETTKLNGQDIINTKEYEYNAINNNSPSKIIVNNELITKMYYPSDLLQEPFMQNLVTQNRIGTPIKVETFKNTEKLSEQKTTFANDASTSNLLQVKKIYSAKFPNNLPVLTSPVNSQLELKLTSDLYDPQGNLLQFKKENDLTVSIIWGYNKTQPIAKIENLAYNSIPISTIDNLQNKSNADNDSCTSFPCSGNEENLRIALNSLRSTYPDAMITTYTYNPLIGVTSITDPKGDIVYYNYDTFGRLQLVKDKAGNVLSENQYNYRPN